MKFRITLFVIMSEIFIPINSANATQTDIDRYFYYIGSATSICEAYSRNAISEKNAIMMFNSITKDANRDLSNTKESFNFFVKNGENFTKYGCSKLIN